MTVYSRNDDFAAMFATPRYVVKGGELIVEEGQLRRAPAGARFSIAPQYDKSIEKHLKRHFEQYSSVSLENYGGRG